MPALKSACARVRHYFPPQRTLFFYLCFYFCGLVALIAAIRCRIFTRCHGDVAGPGAALPVPTRRPRFELRSGRAAFSSVSSGGGSRSPGPGPAAPAPARRGELAAAGRGNAHQFMRQLLPRVYSKWDHILDAFVKKRHIFSRISFKCKSFRK